MRIEKYNDYNLNPFSFNKQVMFISKTLKVKLVGQNSKHKLSKHISISSHVLYIKKRSYQNYEHII